MAIHANSYLKQRHQLIENLRFVVFQHLWMHFFKFQYNKVLCIVKSILLEYFGKINGIKYPMSACQMIQLFLSWKIMQFKCTGYIYINNDNIHSGKCSPSMYHICRWHFMLWWQWHKMTEAKCISRNLWKKTKPKYPHAGWIFKCWNS